MHYLTYFCYLMSKSNITTMMIYNLAGINININKREHVLFKISHKIYFILINLYVLLYLNHLECKLFQLGSLINLDL